MRHVTVMIVVLILSYLAAWPVQAQHKSDAPRSVAVDTLFDSLPVLEGLDLSGLKFALERLGFSMQALRGNLSLLGEVTIPPIEIPEIQIPPIQLPDLGANLNMLASNPFGDLDEEDRLRLEALRAIANRSTGDAVPRLQRVLREERSPALRYEAVRLLGRFGSDKRVVPILGEVARKDKNIEVRKEAIYLLGKSGDPRAVSILEEMVRQ